MQQEILDEMQEFHTALKADINPETEDKSGLALSIQPSILSFVCLGALFGHFGLMFGPVSRL